MQCAFLVDLLRFCRNHAQPYCMQSYASQRVSIQEGKMTHTLQQQATTILVVLVVVLHIASIGGQGQQR